MEARNIAPQKIINSFVFKPITEINLKKKEIKLKYLHSSF